MRAERCARRGPTAAHLALGLVAVASAFAAVAVGSERSTRPDVPAFLSHQLGGPQRSPFVSKDRVSTVEVAGGGFSVATRKGTVALNLAMRGAGSWAPFERGAARDTPVGVETVTRSVTGAEDFLAVRDHHGSRAWRWALDTPGLRPALLGNGQVAFRVPGAQWAGMWIPEPRVLDRSGRDVSPLGLHWTLTKSHVGGAVLALRLNDAQLPTPYVIDPGVTFVAAGVVQSSASATSLSITGPAGMSAGDIEVAFVTAKNNATISAPDASWNAVTSGQGGSTAGQTRNGTGIETFVFWHKATGIADVGPFSFGFTGTAVAMAGDIVAFTGADQNAPVDLGPTTLFAGSAGNVTGNTAFNSATPTTALSNDMFLVFYGTSVANLLGITPQASTPTDTEDFDSNALMTTSVEAEGGHGGTVAAGTAAAFSAKNPSTATWISNVVPLVPPLSAQGGGTMTLTSIDGSGGAANVSASSTGHTFVFTYTAASGGINRGSVTLAVPLGWTAPSTSSANNGFTTSAKGTVGVSGQTITVSNLMLDGGATFTITYGDKSGTGTGATIGSGTGSHTFTTQETSYSSGSLTSLGASPAATVLAADGSGTMALTSLDGGAGTHVSASSTGHTLVFTYTAAAGGIGGGKVDLLVPTGWSAPSTTNTVNGYSTSSAGTLGVSGQTISVTGLTLAGGATFTITYGNKNSGSNNGATIGATTGSAAFSAKENSTGGTTVALGASPSLTVTAADGSGTLTADTANVSASSAGNTITFTYTAAAGGTSNGTVSIDVPTGWDAPSTTASAPGAVSSDAGTIGVVGRTVTVTGLTLAGGGTVHIKYGDKTGGPGAAAPATTGPQSWPAKENSTGGTTVALGVSPSITVDAADGSGTLSADTTNVSASSTGNTITFTYAAAVGGMTNGTVSVDVPTGWSAPSTTASAAGAVSTDAGTIGVSVRTITVSGLTLSGGATVHIKYGDKTGGPGATAPAAVGAQTWNAKQSSTGGATVALAAGSPAVTVNAADGSGAISADTSSVAAGASGRTIVFTYTAAAGGLANGTVTVTVPSGWTAPTTGNSSSDAGTLGVVGRTLTVTGITLSGASAFHITYGTGASATAPTSAGAQAWNAAESSTGGTTAPIPSPSITVTNAAASQLVYTTQPGGATAGAPFSQQPVITIKDAFGNTVTTGADAGANVTMSIQTGGGSVQGTVTVAAAAGVATFSNLEIDTTGTRTLRATKADTSGAGGTNTITADSNSFAVAAAAAAQLVFTTQPGGAGAGSAFSQQPVVTIEDSFGNTITSGADSTRNVTISLPTGTGPLQGTTTIAAVAGVATFTNLEIDSTGSKTLRASATLAGTPRTASSSAFTVGAAATRQLAFTTQPGGAAAGAAFGQQPVVTIEDNFGNTIDSGPDSTASVTVALQAGTGPLQGTATVSAVGGVATFTDLRLDVTGSKTLQASATLSGTPRTANSNPFTVTNGAASQLVFTTQPAGATSGSDFLTQPVVTIEDQFGNTVASGGDATATVTMSLATGTGTLAGTTSKAAVGGVATFTNLRIDTAGAKTLRAAATLNGSPVTQDSSSFTVLHGAASQLVFTTQPASATAGAAFGQQPVVTIEDAAGNVVADGPDSTASVSIVRQSGTGTLQGTTAIAAVSGVATLTSLRIDTTGSKTLQASATLNGTGRTADSNAFTVANAAAASLTFTAQPAGATSGSDFLTQPVVTIDDQFGNTVTSGTDATATVTISLHTGTGTLAGTTSKAAVGGVATFTNLRIDTAGTKTLRAAATLNGSPVTQDSSSFTVLHGAASQLVFMTQPASATAGAVLGQQPVVTIEDAAGNVVADGPDSTANVSIVRQSGTGTLQGTTTVAAVNGVATFTDLRLDVTGTKTLRASATLNGTGRTADSTAFTVANAAAASLAFMTQPGGAVAGSAFSQQPVVTIVDSFGNTVTEGPDAGDTVSIALQGGSGPLQGTASVAAVSGVATFTDLRLDATGAKTLRASATLNGTPATIDSSSFTVGSAPASQLVFTTQPGGATAGAAFSQQPAVSIEDTFGNVVTSGPDATATVTMSLQSGTGSLAGAASKAAVAGIATFTNLRIDTAGMKTLRAAATLNGSPVTRDSSSFTVVHGTASQIAFTTQPGSATAGAAFGQQPVVAIQDAFGNTVDSGADSTDSVTINLLSGTGTLSGTATVAAVNGLASFTNLSIDLTGSKTLHASATVNGSGQTADSSSFTVSPAAGTQLVFTTQPGGATAGANFTQQPVATIKDQFGNVVTSGSDSTAGVTMSIVGGGAIQGTTTVAAVNGVATFTNLRIDAAGSTTLRASATLNGTGRTADSSSFTVAHASASQLAFTTQPGGAAVGSPFGQQPVVKIEDAFGNVVDDGADSTRTVTITKISGTGTLSGTTAVVASGGVATFTNLSIETTGAKTLRASATVTAGARTVDSASFTVGSDTASQIVFTTQPGSAVSGAAFGQQPVITIEDSFGNTVTAGPDTSDQVTLSIVSGGGTLLGTTTVTASGGVATFTNARIDQAGAFTLRATTAGGHVFTVDSSSFSVAHGAASQFVFTTQPGGATAGANFAQQPVVKIEDAAGNVVDSGPDATASVSIAVQSGGGTLQGATTIAAVNGIAAFTNLRLDTSGAHTFRVSATLNGSPVTRDSSSVSVSPAAAAQLAYTQQPGAANAGSPFAIQPVVALEDQFGNVSTSTADVTIAKQSGPGTLAGTTTKAAVNGVATFTDLTLDQTGTYTLRAASSGLPSVDSSSFTVAAGLATHLQFGTQPGGATAGSAFSQQPVVRILDASNNVVTSGVDASATVTMSIQSGGGTLQGTVSVSAVNGIATFTDLRIDNAGTKTLRAMKADLSGSSGAAQLTQSSSSFAVANAAASRPVFTTQPDGASAAGAPLGTQPVVTVEDAFGNAVTTGADSTATIAIAVSSGPGSWHGSSTTTIAAAAGVATFSNLRLDTPGTYVLGVTKADTSGSGGTGALTQLSSSFAVTAGTSGRVVFTTQPGGATAGTPLGSQPVVAIEDGSGNTITSGPDASASVTLSIATGTGAVAGTTTVAAVNGVATFSGVHIDIAGTKTLRATAAVAGDPLTGTSIAFTIVPAAAAQLGFVTQPGGAAPGAAFTQQPVVAIRDAFGNTVTGSTADVTIAKASGPGTLSGTTTKTTVGGIATFTGLALDQAGSYVLHVAASGLTGADSAAFSVAGGGGGGGGGDTTPPPPPPPPPPPAPPPAIPPVFTGAVPTDGATVAAAATITLDANTSGAWTNLTESFDPQTLAVTTTTNLPDGSGASITRTVNATAAGLYTIRGTLSNAAGIATFTTHFTVFVAPAAGGTVDPPPNAENVTPGTGGSLTTSSGGQQVVWTAATLPADAAVLHVDPAPVTTPVGGFTAGGTSVNVTLVTSSGAQIHALPAPIEIIFDSADASDVPSTSDDGVSWRTLTLLPDRTLHADQADGYWREQTGPAKFRIHILTRHLTLFGLLKDTQAPSAPSGLTGTIGPVDLTLQWQPASDNSGAIDSYGIVVDGHQVQTVPGTQTSAKVSPFATDDARVYQIVAYDAAGNVSPMSAGITQVPNVMGLPLAGATAQILTRGFGVGRVTQQASGADSSAIVVDQSPAPAAMATAGSAIDLTVVSGTRQATLVASVSGANRIFFGGRAYIQVRVKLTLPARIAADLVDLRHKRYARWIVRVDAGVHNVRFALHSVHLRTGHPYQLRLTMRNGTQVVVRRVRVRF